MTKIAILADDVLKTRALKLSRSLDIPVIEQPSDEFAALLLLQENGLSLQICGSKMLPLRIDFSDSKIIKRIKNGDGRGEYIAKAIGINKKPGLSVIDATAGLGRDSFIMAALGAKVTMIERNPIIYSLVQDGLERALGDDKIYEIAQCIKLINADSIEMLTKLDRPDVVYIDPMFPKRTKMASVKKEMQIFQALVKGDLDSTELLTAALSSAKYRVVVKRPPSAKPLSDTKPSFEVKGKAVRFDCYNINHL